MENIYDVLRALYHCVIPVSKRQGIYICKDSRSTDIGDLIVHNNVILTNIAITQITYGLKWFSILKSSGELLVFNKFTGDKIYNEAGIHSVCKNNLYDDRCSTLSLVYKNQDNRSMIILDNVQGIVTDIIRDVTEIHREFKTTEEMYVYTSKGKKFAIAKHMKGIEIKDEAKC